MVCEVAHSRDFAAGTKDTSFLVDTEGNVVISYGPFRDIYWEIRLTKITLKCNPSEPGVGTIANFTEYNQSLEAVVFNGTFTSRFACATRDQVVA